MEEPRRSIAWRFFARWRLFATPSTPIDRVHDGALVRITGRARSIERSGEHAPLSRRGCIAWQVRASDPAGSGGYFPAFESHCPPFAIEETDGGRAIVRAARVLLLIHHDCRAPWSGEITSEFRDRHKNLEFGILGASEGILKDGQAVTAWGFARFEAEADATARAGYRHAARQLVLEAPDAGVLLLGDVDPF
jgi:hypothetical protein